MTCGIYCITNNINGNKYIGQSKHIEQRFKEHKTYNNGSVIHNAILKYGEDNFTFEILLECSEEDLSREEEKFIKLYGTYKQGYNCTWGGEIPPTKCPEVAAKISQTMNGHFTSEETKNKIGAANRGKIFKEAHKSKLSLSQSKSRNTSGFYRVRVQKSKTSTSGFNCKYSYHINGVRKSICAKTIDDLEIKVKSKGLDWIILDNKKAEKTKKQCNSIVRHKKQKRIKKTNKTGIYRVCFDRTTFKYIYYEHKQPKTISRVDINKLKEAVISKGLEWLVLDENKAKANGLV